MGTLLVRRGGYAIKTLNAINFRKSMRYNPFHYIRSEKDILKLVNTIMVNTKGEGEKSSEDFWTKAERLLYCALIGYIWYEAPEEEQNFLTAAANCIATGQIMAGGSMSSPVEIICRRNVHQVTESMETICSR